MQTISISRLALAFIPVVVVLLILSRWSVESRTALYGVARMLAQLLLIGYVLTYIFASDQALVIVGVVAFMLFVSSWIALRPVPEKRRVLYAKVLASLAVGGIPTLALVTQAVLEIEPWYAPRYTVPLGGMVFANAMNTVSLAADRFESENRREVGYEEARRIALRASLIPLVNALFAVGLVSIPGIMTGQILSGVSPLVAVRYQIMVMCMIFGSAGLSAACFLALLRPEGQGAR